ncbi:hypothetical protein [Bacillus sp. Brlt_9]|uniref:hypothetical protein n=1 Tax=Bacillus sp. Brlt_9 TaxID=3110916 RepID=UPI003F7C1D5A
MIITNEKMTDLFPVVVGKWKRLFLSKEIDISKMIKDYDMTTEYENYQDVVLYVDEEFTVKGIVIEYWKNQGFLYTPMEASLSFLDKETKTVAQIFDEGKKWGYEGLELLPTTKNYTIRVQEETAENLEIASLFLMHDLRK